MPTPEEVKAKAQEDALAQKAATASSASAKPAERTQADQAKEQSDAAAKQKEADEQNAKAQKEAEAADEKRRVDAAASEKAAAEEKARITAEQDAVRKADAEKIAAMRQEPDGDLSKEQEAALDQMFGDEPEGSDFERDAPGELQDAIRVLHRLHAAVPDATPDSHTIWGAGGVVLNVGHLRTLVKHSPVLRD